MENIEESGNSLEKEINEIVKENSQKRRQAGSAAGQIFIASDFDEPLEEFKDYME